MPQWQREHSRLLRSQHSASHRTAFHNAWRCSAVGDLEIQSYRSQRTRHRGLGKAIRHIPLVRKANQRQNTRARARDTGENQWVLRGRLYDGANESATQCNCSNRRRYTPYVAVIEKKHLMQAHTQVIRVCPRTPLDRCHRTNALPHGPDANVTCGSKGGGQEGGLEVSTGYFE